MVISFPVDLVGGNVEDEILCISAKEGKGIIELVEAIIERIPPPSGSEINPLRALIFDSLYDQYRGVICFLRVVDGSIKKGQKIRFHSTSREYEVEEIGRLRLERVPCDSLETGQVGYLIAGVKTLTEARVGDTVINPNSEFVEALSRN